MSLAKAVKALKEKMEGLLGLKKNVKYRPISHTALLPVKARSHKKK